MHQNGYMSLPRRQYETMVEWALRLLDSYKRKRDLRIEVPKVLPKSA